MNNYFKILGSNIYADYEDKKQNKNKNTVISNNLNTEHYVGSNNITLSSMRKSTIEIVQSLFKNKNSQKNTGLNFTVDRSSVGFTNNIIGIELNEEAKKYMPNDTDVYTRDRVKNIYEYMDKFRNGEKAIYMFDFETFGNNPNFHMPDVSAYDPARKYFAITEASLTKLDKVDGKYKASLHSFFFSSPFDKNTDIDKVTSELTQFEGANSNTKVQIQRAIGYSNINIPSNGILNPTDIIFRNDLNQLDPRNIQKGLKNMTYFPKRGSEQYFDDVASFVYNMYNIMNSGDLLMSRNGAVFDMAQLVGEITSHKTENGEYIIANKVRELQKANGVEADFSLERFKSLSEKNHVDTLIMSRMFSIKENQNKLNAGYDGQFSLNMEAELQKIEKKHIKNGTIDEFKDQIVSIVQDLGFGDDIVNKVKEHGVSALQHTGQMDTIVQSIVFDDFINENKNTILEYIDGKGVKDIDIFDGEKYFIANKSIKLNSNDLNFIQYDGGKVVTSSMSNIISKGNIYSIDILKRSDVKNESIALEHFDKDYEDFIGKDAMFVKLTEHTNDNMESKSSYLIFKNKEDLENNFLKQDIFNENYITSNESLESSLEAINIMNKKKNNQYLHSPKIKNVNIDKISLAIEALESKKTYGYTSFDNTKPAMNILNNTNDKFGITDDLVQFLSTNTKNKNMRLQRLFDKDVYNEWAHRTSLDNIKELFTRELFVPNTNIEEERIEIINKIKNASTHKEMYDAIYSDGKSNFKVNDQFIQIKTYDSKEILEKISTPTNYYASDIKFINSIKDDLYGSIDTIKSILNVVKDDQFIPSLDKYLMNNNDEKYLLNNTRLIHYNRMIENIQKDYIDLFSDDNIIDKIFDNNHEINSQFNQIYEAYTKDPSNEFNRTIETEIKKDIFKKFYGEEFIKDSDIVMKELKDKVSLEVSPYTLKNISIKRVDDGYNTLTISDKKGLASQISSSVNMQFKVSADDEIVRVQQRAMYFEDLSKDLLNRGIINEDQFSNIKTSLSHSNTVEAASEILADSIISNRDELVNYLDRISTDEYKKLSDIEKMFYINEIIGTENTSYEHSMAKKFVKNLVPSEELEYRKISIDGKGLDDMIEKIASSKKVSKEEYIKSIGEKNAVITSDSINIKYLNNSKKDNLSQNNLAQIKLHLEEIANNVGEKLGWGDTHKESFFNLLDNSLFYYDKEINSKGDKTKPSFMIAEHNDQMYFIVNKSNDDALELLQSNASLDDIKSKSIVVKLPKIDEQNGVKFINQSKLSHKGIYKNIEAKVTSDGLAYTIKDTVNETLDAINSKIGFAFNSLLDGDAKSANSQIQRALRPIYDSKSLTGGTYQSKFNIDVNGNVSTYTDYVLGLNPDDFYKNHTVSIKNLLLEIGEVLNFNSEKAATLRDKFQVTVGESKYGKGNSSRSYINNLRQSINTMLEEAKKQAPKNKYQKIQNFNEAQQLFNDPSLKLFFSENIEDISDVMLDMYKTGNYSRYAPIVDLLKELKDNGRRSVLSVKPGAGSEMFVNTKLGDSIHLMDYLNLLRSEVAIQDLSAKPISFENIISNYITKDNITKQSELEKYSYKSIIDDIGITPGRSFMDVSYYLNQEKIAKLSTKGTFGVNGFEQGFDSFVAKVKFMSHEEKSKVIAQLRADKDLKKNIIENISSKYGESLNIDNFDEFYDELFNRIDGASSLFEDGRLGHIKLSLLKNPSGVKNYKVHSNVKYENDNWVKTNRWKIGDDIKVKDIIGYDENNKEILSDFYGKVSNITKMDDSRTEIQVLLSNSESTMKLNIGGVERGIVNIPNISDFSGVKKSVAFDIISLIQDKILDGAIVAANPDIKKHDAIPIPVNSRLLNILESISSDEEVAEINKILNNKDISKLLNLQIEKSSSASLSLDTNKYIYVTKHNNNDIKIKQYGIADDIKNIEKAIFENDKLQNVAESIKNKLRVASEKNVVLQTISNVPFNAINAINSDIDDEIGSSYSMRRIVAVNDAIHNIEIANTSQFNADPSMVDRTLHDWVSSMWESNNKDLKEVQNIIYSYEQLMTGTNSHDIKILDKNLNDIVSSLGSSNAHELDEIFSLLSKDNNEYNLVRVDISDLKIKNPIRANVKSDYIHKLKAKYDLDNEAIKHITKEYIDSIYLPIVKSNYVNGTVTLNELQKSMADLLSNLRLYNDRGSSYSYNTIKDRIEKSYSKFIKSHEHELFSKEGKFKQLFKTKSLPFSGRALAQSVIAPAYSDNNKKIFIDKVYGKILREVDGRRQYTRTALINTMDFIEQTGVKLENLGEQILLERHANIIDDQVEVINKVLKNHNIDKTVNNLDDARKLINSKKITKDVLYDIGLQYMKDVGIEGNSARAPFIRLESDVNTFFRISDSVGRGNIIIDALSAKGKKLDVDGDISEYNLGFSLYKGKDGTVKLSHFYDKKRAYVRKNAIHTSERILNMYDNLVLENQGYVKKHFILEEYAKASSAYQDMFNKNGTSTIFNDEHFVRSVASLQSKSIIGQASNPAYYIKAASQEYANKLAQNGQGSYGMLINKSISIGSLDIEQFSIDQKKTKNIDNGVSEAYKHIKNIKDMQGMYDKIFVELRNKENGDANKLKSTLKDMIEILSPRIKEGTVESINGVNVFKDIDGVEYTGGGIVWGRGSAPTKDQLDDIIEGVLNGNVPRVSNHGATTIEEFMYSIVQVLSDNDAARTYKSTLLSNSDRSIINKKLTTIEKALNFFDDVSNGGSLYDSVSKILSGSNLSENIKINGKTIDYNGVEAFVKKGNDFINKGMYNIKQSSIKDGYYSVLFENVIDGSEHKIYSNSVSGLTKELKSMGVKFDLNKKDKLFIINDYINKSLNNGKAINPHAINKLIKDYNMHDTVKMVTNNTNIGNFIVKSISKNKSNDNLNKYFEMSDNLINGMISNKYISNGKQLLDEINKSIRKRGLFDIDEVGSILLNHEPLKDVFAKNSIGSHVINTFINNTIDDGIRSNEVTQFFNKLIADKGINAISDDYLNKYANILLSQGYDNVENINVKNIDDINRLRKSHIQLIADTLKTNLNIDSDKYNKSITDGIIKYSSLDSFKEHIKSIGNLEELGDLTIAWREDLISTKAKYLSNKKLKSILMQSSSVDGIDDEFVSLIKGKISNFLMYREDNNLDLDIEPLSKYHSDFENTLKSSGILNQINEEIREKGLNGKVEANTEKGFASAVADKSKKIFGDLKSNIMKNKVGIGVAALFGLGTLGVIGYNVRNEKKNLSKKEDESNFSNSRLKRNIPMSNKVYVNDSNNISVNVKARTPIGKNVQDGSNAISSAFGNNVEINTSYSDDRSFIDPNEVDEIMSDSVSY